MYQEFKWNFLCKLNVMILKIQMTFYIFNSLYRAMDEWKRQSSIIRNLKQENRVKYLRIFLNK